MFKRGNHQTLLPPLVELAVGVISLSFLLASCSTTQSKKTAELAVAKFHRQLDFQQCHDIYTQSDLEFRQSFTERNFHQFCTQISRKLGSVKNTLQADGDVNITAKETLVTLIYETEFKQGLAQEHFVWSVKHDNAVLHQYAIDMKPSQLHAAARAGDKPTVERLIQSGADIHSKDPEGASVLQNAARSGNKELVEFLLERGANINDRDDNGVTPLNWAVNSGNTQVVKLLIVQGAETKIRANNGMTLLHDAAYSCNPDMVRLIISQGGNVKIKANDGATALHSAALCQKQSVIELLISQGVDVNAKTKEGATAATIARVGGNHAIAKLLQTERAK